MASIRKQLLRRLIPPLILLVLLVSWFIYVQWSHEIARAKEETISLLGDKAPLSFLDKAERNALFVVLIGGAATIAVMIFSVTLVANRISRPVKQLNTAALAIAAGEYGEKVEEAGPKEVRELASTLNTLSECLEETMARLQESSAARERMVGEYECSLLLQHYMLQREIDHLSAKTLQGEVIKSSTGIPSRALALQTVSPTHLRFSEAIAPGFAPLYTLLSQGSDRTIDLQLDDKPTATVHNMTQPIFWSAKEGDYVFIVNTPLASRFPHRQALEMWFNKVLRHFADEGFHLLTTMLHNELHFLSKKNPMSEDLIIVALQQKKSN